LRQAQQAPLLALLGPLERSPFHTMSPHQPLLPSHLNTSAVEHPGFKARLPSQLLPVLPHSSSPKSSFILEASSINRSWNGKGYGFNDLGFDVLEIPRIETNFSRHSLHYL